MPSKAVTPGNRRKEVEERAEAVFKHRRAGGQIDRALATKLAGDGFTDPAGFPLSVKTLQGDYAKYVNSQVIFHRDTFEFFGTLQIMRLERNISILDQYLSLFDVEPDPETGEDGLPQVAPGHIFSVTALAREIRQSIDSITKLVGANAPTEVVITQRLESEVEQMIAILQQGLPEEVFTQVAQCLAKGMGLVKERVITEEQSAIAGYEVLEVD